MQYGNSKIHGIDENTSAILFWEAPVMTGMSLAGIPPVFGRAWMTIESGGNICAVGEATATGPDGFPREVGLFQIYNPDDFRQLGASASEIWTGVCAMPAPGPKQRPSGDGGFADGSQRNPQHQIAQPTEQQIERNVQLGVGLVQMKQRYADKYLDGNGVTWPKDGPDYWSMVKAVHALPVIVNTGIAQVCHHLGRPPSSWQEFRSTYEIVQPRARFNPNVPAGHDQDGYFRALDNAEWTGFHVGAA